MKCRARTVQCRDELGEAILISRVLFVVVVGTADDGQVLIVGASLKQVAFELVRNSAISVAGTLQKPVVIALDLGTRVQMLRHQDAGHCPRNVVRGDTTFPHQEGGPEARSLIIVLRAHGG